MTAGDHNESFPRLHRQLDGEETGLGTRKKFKDGRMWHSVDSVVAGTC